ncbi:uncharacterized protein LOC124927296 isoform X2 [Impatiens glandulifera]|nr:uncharacterized protein LOC124927296 isoform X2 [Impatiens glandulifera]
MNVSIDIFDEFGVGGGASGSSGGLLHPYSPKVKLLWRGAECWRESLRLLGIAEEAAAANGCLIKRRGILRPALSLKHLNILKDNAQNSLPSCRIEQIDQDDTRKPVPGLLVPLNLSFFMPEAISINPQLYLQSLFQACETEANRFHGRELRLHRKSINDLLELEGEFDDVIVCLGARATILPQLIGKLPLRTCRGVIAHLQLPQDIREDFLEDSPSILSDAWLAIKGKRDLHLGSTWEWNSNNYSNHVSMEETSKALEELLPKASGVYPGINSWTLAKAYAGLRAMPPLTVNGSLPLLGSIDHIIGDNRKCKFWLFGGLGARGLFYHAWLGKLLAQAVLFSNEDLLPSELTTWKKKNKVERQ